VNTVAQSEVIRRIYERLCLASALSIAFVVMPANLLQGMPWVLQVLAAAFGLVSVWLYRLARRGRCYPLAFLAGMVVTTTLMWFPNAGAAGSIPFFFLPAVTYAAIFFRGRMRVGVVLAIVLDPLGLMLFENFKPEWITPFISQSAMRIDLAVGLATSALLTMIMLWVVTDAYDREQRGRAASLQALDEAREEFARLFQMNPDAVYLVDPERPAYVDVNHGFERLTGWNKPEAVGRSAEDLKLWANPDERTKFYEELGRQGYLQNFLARFRCRNGTEIWGSTSANWVEMSGRRLLLLNTRDVTTRIDAQRRDAESRALLAALIDSTSDGVWQVDPVRFAFTAFNAAFAERLRREWGVELVLGRTLEELASPEVAATWRAFYMRALAEGPFSTEYVLDNGNRTTLISLSPVTHEGEVFGVSVFSRDITQLKRAAAERATIEQQLLQSQKMESLGSLAGGVAHDFNNMLTAIMGYAELLLPGEPSTDRRQSLLAIMQAATRSRELTGKLLAFGRRGKNIVQSVDLAAVVRDSVAMLRPSFRADLDVVIDMRGAWLVDGDPSQMSQVIVNLCINANEAMPHGGTLVLSSANLTLAEADAKLAGLGAGDYLCLRVSDSGVGMDADVRVRIFEPFFTTKVGGQVRGTGLGLSTVYGIIQSHGGNIVVDSTPGEGTTFSVYLPKGVLAPEQPQPQAAISAGSGVILIAEDEDMIRQLLVHAIEGLGYRALGAVDGEDAVRVFTAHAHELTGVLLDLKMPRKSGSAAFMEMHAIAPQVPVLICSGYGDNAEAQQLITLGAKGLLAKPFTMSDLSLHLAKLAR
jgi:two-component system, cell cycle sensor histidine kinase and response regulator CckA